VSLIPAFEIGVWNAWIFMLYILAHTTLLSLLFKNASKKIGSPSKLPYTESENRINVFRHVILVLAFIYSVFLPLRLVTAWFYIGLPVYLVGLIMYAIVMVNFATTPPDEPVIKGLYRYSRHPQYLTQSLMFIGIGIASASWVFLLFQIITMILINILAIPEERFCLDKYGDAYREYLNRTPRWVGVPRSGR